jgi:hypothetical protein
VEEATMGVEVQTGVTETDDVNGVVGVSDEDDG